MKAPQPVAFGLFLNPNKRPYELSPTEDADLIGMRLYGSGPFHRERKPAMQIKKKSHFVVRAGDIVYNKLFAWKGTFGVVPPELDGMFASDKFPTYAIDECAVDRDYIRWYFRYPPLWKQAEGMSKGVAALSKLTLNPPDFLKLTIPLPPLAEQRRIVARIEELSAKIEEARGLRRLSGEASEQLVAAEAARVFAEIAADFDTASFGSFNPHVTSGPRSWATRYVEKHNKSYRFYRAQDIGPRGDVASDSMVFIDPPDSKQGLSARLQAGDLFIVITGATVGRCSIFRNGFHPGYVSQHVAICRLPPDHVNADYALKFLLSPAGQEQLLGQRYGQGKPGLNLSSIRGIRIPLPGLDQQRAIVNYFDGLEDTAGRARALQSNAAAELDALLPSILDKAFKGEL